MDSTDADVIAHASYRSNFPHGSWEKLPEEEREKWRAATIALVDYFRPIIDAVRAAERARIAKWLRKARKDMSLEMGARLADELEAQGTAPATERRSHACR